MNKEIYEALKRIVELLNEKRFKDKGFRCFNVGKIQVADLKQVENWIDEVEKEHTEEIPARKLGEYLG